MYRVGSYLLFVFLVIIFFVSQVTASDYESSQVDGTNFPCLYITSPNLQGEAVWLLQARLKELGYELKPTGVYTNDTQDTVKLFQVASNLEPTGIVTEDVWYSLIPSEANNYIIAEDDRLLTGKLVIEIEITTLLLTVFQDGEEVAKYPIAVGKNSTPSPLGEWKIVHKSLNWGGGFGTRWLGLNVPWGIYGIHGTNKPGSIGSYASHGCIRMFNGDVEKLYPTIPIGTRVRILEKGKMFPGNIKPIVLKAGASGQQVVYVQSRLKELGYEFDRADGRFGKMTELAIRYYQAWHLLEASGIVDEATYSSLGML
ncbi:MAG: L,D-transpeptidase family protein [Syntrophomonadaceae bacterium]|nr:L,D-transpeptidase family protein [Syntrophomonadaceae bacterium]